MKIRMLAAVTGLLAVSALLLPPVEEVRSQQEIKGKREPLVDRVKSAIERGVQYLRDKEDGRGHWEHIPELALSMPMEGGPSALALLALLNSGVKANDPIIERGLKHLRKLKNDRTYVVALNTMVFQAAGKDIDRIRIQKNVDWLLKGGRNNGQFVGWTYSQVGNLPDNSNTQYALLGLHAGKLAGAKIPDSVWKEIRSYYVNTQQRDGGWPYRSNEQTSSITMTCAGLTGLYIAGMELSARTSCGIYDDNEPLQKAHAWIAHNFRFKDARASFYNMYGIERVGRLSGQRFLGEHDWYREGCRVLVGLDDKDGPLAQRRDGSWRGDNSTLDKWPVISTSFALLFLSRGRTPVLISKLKHGPGDDWNNDRYDARNLVRHARKVMFKNQPLGWQIFAPRQTRMENDEQLLDVTSELLQSPIVYLNGHRAPQLTENEIKLLRKFVDNGGFILAEACCGDQRFDRGFRQLIPKLFPDNQLQPLSPEHPIWRSYHTISDFKTFPLEGIQQGCKTVLVYSREDMSCLWEKGVWEVGEAQLAFRLAGNIIAYATGLELPKPRLTPVEVTREHADKTEIPRGYLQVAQLRHQGDWQPAPRAMRNLMTHLRDTAGLDVVLSTMPMTPNHPDFPKFKFLYLHGRNKFTFSDKEIAKIRADLETGGLLLADACCGRKEFDKSFREFANKIFPAVKEARLERIPLEDELFSAQLNGKAIRAVRGRRENASGTGAQAEMRNAPPYLEGVKYKGRWVVIYSKYDLGCALEKHQSPECLGHDYESALELAGAAVLYALMR